MLNFCDFIQVYVFSTNHHLNTLVIYLNGVFIHTPVTQRQPARQRTTTATEINKQAKGTMCLGTTCHGSG